MWIARAFAMSPHLVLCARMASNEVIVTVAGRRNVHKDRPHSVTLSEDQEWFTAGQVAVDWSINQWKYRGLKNRS